MRPYSRSKLKKAVFAAAVVVTSCVAALGPGGALSVGAQPNNGAGLAQEYLAALKPAGAAISNAEAKLERLPVTASVAQVKAIVAPLHKVLGPLGTLMHGAWPTASPTPTSGSTSLEALPLPTFQDNCGDCTGKVDHLSDALIGHAIYKHGLQLVTTCSNCGFNGVWVDYRWEIGSQYTHFSGALASGAGNGCYSTLIRILGSQGRPIPFLYEGVVTEGLTITNRSTRLQSISVDVASQSSMSVWLGFSCPLTSTSVVDVVNAHFS